MNNELNVSGLKHGVIIGGIGAIVTFILTIIGRDTFIELNGIMTLTISIGLVISFGRRERRQIFNNELNYLAAFVYASVAYFIAFFMGQLSNIAVYQLIDPGIKEVLMTQGMEAVEEGLRMSQNWIDMGETEVDKMLDQAERDLKQSFTIYSVVTNSWATLLGALFLGAISALFIRKAKPDFSEE